MYGGGAVREAEGRVCSPLCCGLLCVAGVLMGCFGGGTCLRHGFVLRADRWAWVRAEGRQVGISLHQAGHVVHQGPGNERQRVGSAWRTVWRFHNEGACICTGLLHGDPSWHCMVSSTCMAALQVCACRQGATACVHAQGGLAAAAAERAGLGEDQQRRHVMLLCLPVLVLVHRA
jgi:hypothetical protein